MFSTIRKRAANRANAQHSTGPVTAEGKAAVARNAVKHGLTGRFFVLEGEGQENYDALLNQFIEDEKPAGIAEIELVKKMAQHTWQSQRAQRLLDACFVIINQTEERRAKGQAELHVRPELERYTRYQSHHDRAYQRASKELRDRRKERGKADRGFVSQKEKEAAEQRRENTESRKQELHKWAVLFAEAKVEHRQMLTTNAKMPKPAPDGKPESRVTAQQTA